MSSASLQSSFSEQINIRSITNEFKLGSGYLGILEELCFVLKKKKKAVWIQRASLHGMACV